MINHPAPGPHWGYSLSALEHSAFVCAGLLLYVMVTRIGQQRRPPSAAFAWVLTIAAIPYLGIPLFLLFGTRKLPRGHRPGPPQSWQDAAPAGPAWASGLLAVLAVPAQTRNQAVTFHADGAAARDAAMDLIERARLRIDLCTFLLGADVFGDALVAALVRRARDGVSIRMLLDAVGSRGSAPAQLRALRDAGVDVRWFMPLLHNAGRARINLRNHRKLLLCDDARLWSGGRNFAVEYFAEHAGAPAWIDLSFVVEGALAAQAAALFERDWQAAGGAARALSQSGMAAPAPAQGIPAQLVPSGPDHADDTVYALLLTAAYQAQRRIIAVTPYFVPDEVLLAAWRMACRRGVRLVLLVPARSNHRLADWARERALRDLADAGAEIYLFPTMMHAKAVIVDDALALCGSTNLDARSLFLNFELMTAFYAEAEIQWLAEWAMQQTRRSSRFVAREPAWWRDLGEGVVREIGYQL